MATKSDDDRHVEMWKMKKLIKSLEAARGCVRELRRDHAALQPPVRSLTDATPAPPARNGTSMISLIIPPKDQVRKRAWVRRGGRTMTPAPVLARRSPS